MKKNKGKSFTIRGNDLEIISNIDFLLEYVKKFCEFIDNEQ